MRPVPVTVVVVASECTARTLATAKPVVPPTSATWPDASRVVPVVVRTRCSVPPVSVSRGPVAEPTTADTSSASMSTVLPERVTARLPVSVTPPGRVTVTPVPTTRVVFAAISTPPTVSGVVVGL